MSGHRAFLGHHSGGGEAQSVERDTAGAAQGSLDLQGGWGCLVLRLSGIQAALDAAEELRRESGLRAGSSPGPRGKKKDSCWSCREGVWLDSSRLELGGCRWWEHREAFFRRLDGLLCVADPDEKKQSVVSRHLLSWLKVDE